MTARVAAVARMRRDAVAARAWALVQCLRARPWHTGMAAFVAGLVAGPRAPLAVPVLALACPVFALRTAARVALPLAVLVGAVVAQSRLDAVDATHLTARMGHAVHARVVLLETPRRRAFGTRVAAVRLDGERVLLRAGRGVRWPSERIGTVLAVRGGLEPLPERESFLRVRGVHAQLRADELTATGAVRGGAAGVVDGVRARAQATLQTGVPPPVGALLRGMVLGDDAALSDDARDEFRASGLSHLMAASGQNVMLLAALILALAAALGLGLRARLALVLGAIALYVPLAGAGPSIVRAGIMAGAGIVAILASRPAGRWYALLLSAGATLTLNPRAIEDVGWQLSFAAVAAILLLAGRMRQGLERRGVPGGLAEAAALTGAATLGTAPLIASHFGQSSLVSLPANIAVAPAVAPIMWLGMLAATVGQVSAALAAPLTALAGLPAAYVMWVAHAAAGLPGAQASVPVIVVSAACVAIAIGVTMRRTRPFVVASAVAAIAFMIVLPRVHSDAVAAPIGLRITFLDVGQGDATLIQRRQAAILVDTGPPDGPVLTRLRHAGVRRLDLLVVTHAQADHDGAAAAVLRALPVALVLDGRDGVRDRPGAQMAAEAQRRHVRVVAGRAGEVLRIGAVALRVLWPEPDVASVKVGADPNQRAIVAEAQADGVRVLLTADAESDVLDRLDLGTVDILKVSHHGSADPGLPALLERLRPRLAAVEVGRHNSYGHPAPATIRALQAAGAAVARTDRDGSIRVEPTRGALRIQTHV